MYNKVISIGRLTADPILHTTPSGKSYVRVSLAVNRSYKSSKGEREADFLPLVFWGKGAEHLAQYAKKGTLLSIEGQIRTYRYEKDGQSHFSMDVLGQNFRFLESRSQRAIRENASLDGLSGVLVDQEELPF